MAFTNSFQRNIGTTAVSIYTPSASQTSILIELDIANTSNSAVTVDVYISKGGEDFYVVKGAPVPYGSALQVVSGQKIVLKDTDTIKVKSSAAASIDCIASILAGV